MNPPPVFRRIGATAVVIALALVVSACLISPGKFTSVLDLRKDGRFSYSYTGEVYMLGLSKLTELGGKAVAADKFEPSTCYKHDDSDDRMHEHECTTEELAMQKLEWDEGQKSRDEKGKKDSEMMRALLGGIDPTSPKAAEEFADRLRRQAGWKSVIYKGGGLFEVDFAIAGRIDHDFTFPTIERFPMGNAFVTLNRRADGTIRMDAPGFGPGSIGDGAIAELALMAAVKGNDKEDDAIPKFPALDGNLVLTTDGAILANNTDEGPKAGTAGQMLEWKISPLSTAAPTALVRLGG